ncbi:12444_t:CDS:2 [Funneliformis mosseae]|uniref:12444_t:CDS:1 n=1 Tax=Funneliformis mosseae TaxID=27381 RepID=A0A9N9F1U8_FUNMO|nr:12444_t:CDS:2 [Funneliformis mosseae]
MTNVGLTANNPDISRETVENHSQVKKVKIHASSKKRNQEENNVFNPSFNKHCQALIKCAKEYVKAELSIPELNYDFYWAANEISKILSKVKGVTYDDDDLEGYDLGECDNSMEDFGITILWKHVKIEYPTVKSFYIFAKTKTVSRKCKKFNGLRR